MANGNGTKVGWSWVAGVLLTVVFAVVGVIYAKDSKQIETNTNNIARIAEKVDSLIVGQNMQALRDSFARVEDTKFKQAVLKALNVKPDSADSN